MWKPVLNWVKKLKQRTWLNKIRFRAGMPAITDAGAALRDRYRNERRIRTGL